MISQSKKQTVLHKLMIIIITALILTITIVAYRYHRIKQAYQRIEHAMPAQMVTEIMGEPQMIYDEGRQIAWAYYQYPIPTVYSIYLEDGKVATKQVSISP